MDASTPAAAGASTPAAIAAWTPPAEPYTLMICAHCPRRHVPCAGCSDLHWRILCAKARGWRKVQARSGFNWWCPDCNAHRFTADYPPVMPQEPEHCCVTNHGDEDARWWAARLRECGVLPPDASTPEQPPRSATGSPAPAENDPAMEERLRSLEAQLERVTAQLTEREAALERVTAQLEGRVEVLETRWVGLVEQREAQGTAERVTDVTAQLTERVSALETACAEHGARLGGVERRTNELSEERDSLRQWWQRPPLTASPEAPFNPQQLMDNRNLP